MFSLIRLVFDAFKESQVRHLSPATFRLSNILMCWFPRKYRSATMKALQPVLS
jgi:hypothetical protein